MSSPAVQSLVTQVRAVLAAHADPERAAGQQRYMKSEMPFHGLATPVRRAVVRPVLTEHRLATRAEWAAGIRLLWDGASHREERYAALDLLRHRAYREWRDADLLPLLEHLITTGAWWDLVDETTHVLGEVLATDAATADVLRRWAVADDMWLRRASIIAQLDARERTDVALLTECLDANLDDREFFVRKAIGWALRQHARVDPAWVRAYVASRADRLSGLSTREALKHIGPA